MKLDKSVIAAVIALVAIAAAVSAYYGYDLWQEQQPDTVGEGDFVELYYIGYYENGTVFSSSFTGENISADASFDAADGLTPFRAYMGMQRPSAGAYPKNWTAADLDTLQGARLYDIPGLYDRLVGMKEGDVEVIGPLPPEDAYGYSVRQAADNGTVITGNFTGIPGQHVKIRNASEGNISLECMMEVGQTFTMPYNWFTTSAVQHPLWLWENATEVVAVNETHITTKTTPNKLENLTLVIPSYVGKISYWDNATDVVNLTDTSVTLALNPEVGDSTSIAGQVLTVENISGDTINVSISSGNGQKRYTELNRTLPPFNLTVSLPRVITGMPRQYIEGALTDAGYSFSDMAGTTVSFKVKIRRVL